MDGKKISISDLYFYPKQKKKKIIEMVRHAIN